MNPAEFSELFNTSFIESFDNESVDGLVELLYGLFFGHFGFWLICLLDAIATVAQTVPAHCSDTPRVHPQ